MMTGRQMLCFVALYLNLIGGMQARICIARFVRLG